MSMSNVCACSMAGIAVLRTSSANASIFALVFRIEKNMAPRITICSTTATEVTATNTLMSFIGIALIPADSAQNLSSASKKTKQETRGSRLEFPTFSRGRPVFQLPRPRVHFPCARSRYRDRDQSNRPRSRGLVSRADGPSQNSPPLEREEHLEFPRQTVERTKVLPLRQCLIRPKTKPNRFRYCPPWGSPIES